VNKTPCKDEPNFIPCGARTRSGNPCKKPPISGKQRCKNHGGLSTGPKTAEGKARIALAQFKHGRYLRWRERRALGQDGEALLNAIHSLIWMPREFLSAFRKGWRQHSLYALDVDTALEMDLEDAKRYIASGVLPHESN